MLHLLGPRGVRFCDGMSRRDFLNAGTLAAGSIGLSLADLARLRAADAGAGKDVNCILLFLVGGPSHLDTWDLKPGAAESIRGPFRPIHTNVAGIQIGEHFPRMAQMAQRYALVRSVHHEAAAIHETGHQLMQTGYLSTSERHYPHFGATISCLKGPKSPGLPSFVIVPRPISNTGIDIGHGQSAGYLGSRHEPVLLHGDPNAAGFNVSSVSMPGVDPARFHNRCELLDIIDTAQRAFDATQRGVPANGAFNVLFTSQARRAFDLAREKECVRDRYGRNTFGQSCLLARRLVEHGVRLVTVNMFDTVFNRVTWDCHADGGSLRTTLDDYRSTLCPMFDTAYTALLEDLRQRGMLDNTLVVAMGEFGRTPHLNPCGGRDHWPGVWSILFAGGGIRGGQVVGASDRIGAEPRDRPVDPGMVAATVYKALGVDLKTRLPGPHNRPLPITESSAIDELFV